MTESILLIGAAGFVGRHLTRALLDQGRHVIAVTRHGNEGIDPRATQVASHTLRDEIGGWAPILDSSSAVMYLASGSTPSSTSGQPRNEIEENLLPLLTILEELQSRPTLRLQYLSSAGSLYAPTDCNPSKETDRVTPRSYHGAGKVAAEHFIAAWCAQFSGAATIIRPSNIFGPGQPARPGFGVIPNAFARMMRGMDMDVWGDGSQTRDYLYVGDLVDLCLAALSSEPFNGVRIVNAARGESTSLNDLFAMLEETSGLTLHRIYHPQRAVDADHIAIDATRANKLFDWTAQTTLAAGLKETWQWFQSSES